MPNQYAPLICPPGATRYERKLFSRWRQRHGGVGTWEQWKHAGATQYERVRGYFAAGRNKQGAPRRYAYPEGTPPHMRRRFSEWIRNGNEDGTWEQWRATVATNIRKRNEARQGKPTKGRDKHAYPPGTPPLWKKRYRWFLCTQGRCTFAAWLRWQKGGPYPLQYI